MAISEVPPAATVRLRNSLAIVDKYYRTLCIVQSTQPSLVDIHIQHGPSLVCAAVACSLVCTYSGVYDAYADTAV